MIVPTVKFTGNHAANFAQTNNCGSSLPANSSCTISVTFTPSQKGTVKATLEVDGGGGAPLTASLTGWVLRLAQCSIQEMTGQ